MARPLGVAMRARKPWLRALLTLLGWYVLFIALAPCVWLRQDRWQQVYQPDFRSVEEEDVCVYPYLYRGPKGFLQIKVPIDR